MTMKKEIRPEARISLFLEQRRSAQRALTRPLSRSSSRRCAGRFGTAVRMIVRA